MHSLTGAYSVDEGAAQAALRPACSQQGVLEWCCHLVLDMSSLPAGDMNVTPREGSFTLPKVPGASQSAPSSGRPQPGPQPLLQASTSGSAWAWPSMLPAFASGPGAGQPCSACHLSCIKGRSGLLCMPPFLYQGQVGPAQDGVGLAQRAACLCSRAGSGRTHSARGVSPSKGQDTTMYPLACTLRSTTSR